MLLHLAQAFLPLCTAPRCCWVGKRARRTPLFYALLHLAQALLPLHTICPRHYWLDYEIAARLPFALRPNELTLQRASSVMWHVCSCADLCVGGEGGEGGGGAGGLTMQLHRVSRQGVGNRA